MPSNVSHVLRGQKEMLTWAIFLMIKAFNKKTLFYCLERNAITLQEIIQFLPCIDIDMQMKKILRC
jgi:hypothetical protein